MKRLMPSLALLTAALAPPLPAQAAGLTRTFVSSSGNDANTCTVTAPCRTFAGAYAKTAANGIITALDPAGYGSLTISQAITMDGNGWAAISAPANGSAIVVNAGASDKVILRGLTVDGAGAANATGINFINGASLTVQGCVLRNLQDSDGIEFAPHASSTLAVSDTLAANNALGIIVDPTGSGLTVTVSFNRVAAINNQIGIELDGFDDTSGTIAGAGTDIVVAGNSTHGFSVAAPPGTTAGLTLVRVLAANNNNGLYSQGPGATIWVGQSTIVGNTNGYHANGGVVASFSDNYFADNAGNFGSLGSIAKQ